MSRTTSRKGYLHSTGVNLALLYDFLRRDLLDFVASAPATARGGKVTHSLTICRYMKVAESLQGLVIDPTLVGELGLVAEFTALKVGRNPAPSPTLEFGFIVNPHKERGVEKISPIDCPSFGADFPKTVMYFTRPKVSLMKHIADQILYVKTCISYRYHAEFGQNGPSKGRDAAVLAVLCATTHNLLRESTSGTEMWAWLTQAEPGRVWQLQQQHL